MHCVRHVDFVVFTTLSLEEARRWRITGFHRGRKITFLKERCRCTLNKVLISYSFNMRIFRLAVLGHHTYLSDSFFQYARCAKLAENDVFALCSIASVRKARHLIPACVDWFLWEGASRPQSAFSFKCGKGEKSALGPRLVSRLLEYQNYLAEL